jgi:hypothetical protein
MKMDADGCLIKIGDWEIGLWLNMQSQYRRWGFAIAELNMITYRSFGLYWVTGEMGYKPPPSRGTFGL